MRKVSPNSKNETDYPIYVTLRHPYMEKLDSRTNNKATGLC